MTDPFMDAYRRYLPAVSRFARRIAKGDRDLADDLMQEGWIALHSLPQHRWFEERYVHTVICRAMRYWLRRERALAIVQTEIKPRQTRPKQCQVKTEVRQLHPRVRQRAREGVQRHFRQAA